MPFTTFDNFDNFAPAKDIDPRLKKDVIKKIKELDEKESLEPFFQGILYDTNETPHGPSEIVDIFTHKVKYHREPGIAAFILKGKSFATVRPKDISHQIYRLEKITGLRYAFLAASGTILDEAKEQFLSTSKRLGCVYSILDAHDMARLFIGFGFICPHDGETITGGYCSCGYRPQNSTSNVLQQDALKALSDSHFLGHHSGLVVLPTGAGKTRVAARDIKKRDCKRVIYTAHAHEILESAEYEFLTEFPRKEIFRPRSSFRKTDLRRINIISIQTLVRNLQKFAGVKVDYLVVDEFHHAAARSYKKTITAIKPDFLLGLTATPFRGDRQDVIDLCDGNVVVNHELRTGIESGVLCPYHYFGCFDNIDYSKIIRHGSRYDIRDLERHLIIPERDDAIINKWSEKADGFSTLAFCCSQEHAFRMRKSFIRHGIPAEAYISETSWTDRTNIIDKFKSRQIKVLCVVDILNEGVDLPFVECLLFLRPTESKRIFFQQLGRGLRRYYGKSHCIVIDFIGNFKNAYRILEYQGLEPEEDELEDSLSTTRDTIKGILNLPLGCTVDFDERVIGIIGDQTLNPAFATRHNIARILVYQYERLGKMLGKTPQKIDVDRSLFIGSRFYSMVFGSWEGFLKKMNNRKGRQETVCKTTDADE